MPLTLGSILLYSRSNIGRLFFVVIKILHFGREKVLTSLIKDQKNWECVSLVFKDA